MRYKDKIFGFTLSEVLITLGIIGVVAAMTLPTLIQKHNEKVTVTKVKKFYSLISQGYTFALSKYGTPDLWGFGERDIAEDQEDELSFAVNAVKMRDILLEQVKVLKKCDKASKSQECGISRNIYFASGEKDDTLLAQNASATLADGSAVLFLVTSSNCLYSRGNGKFLTHDCGWSYYDINGIKGPNMFGKDIFPFYLTKYGVVPAGTSDETSYPFSSNSGIGRTAWVINNENLDYLKCPNELGWDKKKKCN